MMDSSSPTLYLIPSELHGDAAICLPNHDLAQVFELEHFAAENIRTARRFLRKIDFPKPIATLQFELLNKDSSPEEIEALLHILESGKSLGLLSEAGCPGVADPGSKLVARCHAKGIAVHPLIGPSSLLLALMGSGFNGQSFAFEGYLPIERDARKQRIRTLEQRSQKENQTQLFIETPYRNQALFQDLLQHLQSHTYLSLAWNLTAADAQIKTLRVADWKKIAEPDIHKKPCVFSFYAGLM